MKYIKSYHRIFNLIILIGLMSKALAVEAPRLAATTALKQSYFCAIFDEVDARDFEKPFADKYPQLNIFHLHPAKVYWGSYDKAKSSIGLNPSSKKHGKGQVLVVLRSENNLSPGDWVKSYRHIGKDKQPPWVYHLIGDDDISADEVKRFLEKFSKEMQEKFPLDK